MTTTLRRLLLLAPPLALAVVLFWHPPGGRPNVFEGVRDDVDAWIAVHVAVLLAIPLLGIAAYMLLDGVRSRAATVSRVALAFFLVFYTAWEATVGLATGILVDYANGLPAGEQAPVAGAIQDLNRNPIVADPSLALVLGASGWIVAMVAAAVALRQAGTAWPATVLVGLAALFAVHPPPIGPVGLVCFAAGALLLERSRARGARAVPGAAAADALAVPAAQVTR